jgi:hypothetical protein
MLEVITDRRLDLPHERQRRLQDERRRREEPVLFKDDDGVIRRRLATVSVDMHPEIPGGLSLGRTRWDLR